MKEKILNSKNGVPYLFLNILFIIVTLILFIYGCTLISTLSSYNDSSAIAIYCAILLTVICGVYAFLVGPFLFASFKMLKANEAFVFTLFGKYHGTLKGEGLFFVNPFVSAFNPTKVTVSTQNLATGLSVKTTKDKNTDYASGKRISLKSITLNNEKQKINDKLGNPIEIGIVVIWKVVDTAKAVFNVDNYSEFLSIQADSALRNIVRLYPYDVCDNGDSDEELSLRGSSLEVSLKLEEELQQQVNIAGVEIIEVKITNLAYAPEIAAVMLQRQQASAIIDARKLIVEGAVGMVKMALAELNEQDIVQLDDERKAAMVSNLLVVLCGNKDAQPIVNSGSIY